MKKILGLDLGTNSIGWALVEKGENINEKTDKILGMGSRIIPMDQAQMGEFDKGNSVSQTAERTSYRGVRRLRERTLLRRERLHRVLNILSFLPEHYAKEIDFDKHLGQFFESTEPKLPWNKNIETGKFEFLFQKSFLEMAEDFKANGYNDKIPYDWTIYYLRKKALSRKIDKQELAWLLLNFNQKRGYYQLRGEEEDENPNKLVEFHSLKVVDVIANEPNSKGDIWYTLTLENGWIYRRSSKIPLFDWKDKTRDFIVTTDLNDDGTVKTDKDGVEKRSFRAPSEDDWTLVKKKTETDIEFTQKTVGTYIYDTLLQNPTQKIRGKLVRTIERRYYKDELIAILTKQIELQPELFTEKKYNDCIRELYRSNTDRQMILNSKDFLYLFVNDILFYQRPLRSQKSLISNCTLEFRKHKDKNGNEVTVYLKAVPKSNPLYQEFRLWQWLYNLKIYTKDDDKDVTSQFIASVEDKVHLFEFLNKRKEIEQKPLIQYLLKQKEIKGKNEVEKYRWNYVEDKKYPGNETKTMISTRLAKVANVPEDFLTSEKEYQLWHIIYSVTDINEFEKALKTFAERHNLNIDSFVDNFKKLPPFKSEYGSFSEKAIKKLLPLMRLGKYWNWNNIDDTTKVRIDRIITGEYDETIKNRVRDKAIDLNTESHYQGLPLWLVQYIVYDRHSEASSCDKWNSVQDLDNYVQDFKQHSLRNPIVEQVITETLRVVRDIWVKYGQGSKDFFNEIHVELGREMKNTAKDREKITNQVTENENTNLRIKALLAELQNDTNIDNVRAYSPSQQEILRIYEDGVLNSGIEIPDDIKKISTTSQPSNSDLQRYKLWLEQKYRSPYTGEIIPLSKLFTSAYEIEHVIPQSRYFDDSFSNKVICEAAVNKLKDRYLGLEFIKKFPGQIVETGFGATVRIFDEFAYQDFVKQHYINNRAKKTKLLLEEIPEKMIERQMNDTRYISKFISQVLSNIVREEKEDDGVNSKNVLPGNGKITTILKQDWGLNDIWNDLILPRFERMNQLTGTNVFTTWNEQYQKNLPTVPLDLAKGFQKKRIDHRHHAMDALAIAFASRDHINLLNNQHAKSETSRYDLQYKLRNSEKWIDKDGKPRDKFTDFKKPYDNFTLDAKNELAKIVVSFKQNLRVINKATNHYQKYENGNKVEVSQDGTNWAIRKPLHKETVFAKVSLRKTKMVSFKEAMKDWKNIVDKPLKEEIKRVIGSYDGKCDAETLNKFFKDQKYKFQDVDISKVEVYYFDNENAAVRKSLDTSFNEKKIKESITDTGIQKILLNYLSAKGNNPEVAFTPEGIEEMNKNITQYNQGKSHQFICKIRVYETIGNKFQVGTSGNKKDKYVEAAKGTNLFFAIYEDENGNRSFETIPLNIVIERLKQRLNEVPETSEKGYKLLFHLSPNDLVYVPTEDEKASGIINHENIDVNRIYKMVSSSGNQCFFIQQLVANSIVNKVEFSALNKMERAITGEMIKDVCIKLKLDRLGNISISK